MDPIRLYITTGELPDDRSRAHKVQVQSARFSLVDELLYKRSLGGPYLKCLTPEQGQYVLAELHEGICRNHSGGGGGTSPPGTHARVLLANYEVRRGRLRQEMRPQPKNVSYLEISGARFDFHL